MLDSTVYVTGGSRTACQSSQSFPSPVLDPGTSDSQDQPLPATQVNKYIWIMMNNQALHLQKFSLVWIKAFIWPIYKMCLDNLFTV